MARPGKVIDFEERINGCFRRSMNGKPLDRDSREMKAMLAYIDWMKGNYNPKDSIPGRGNGKVPDTLIPDEANGKLVYEKQCALCHGTNGQGVRDADGTQAIPPVWGDDSFNIGAGIARTFTAAAFVKSNMPIAATLQFPLGQGGLTDQEAVDVAQYFSHLPRPDFPDKEKDWPSGGKPGDARY
jgi:thiosulfate dehydrogenase